MTPRKYVTHFKIPAKGNEKLLKHIRKNSTVDIESLLESISDDETSDSNSDSDSDST